MKGGQTPIHIQRWAPADLWADEHWKVLVRRRDYSTMSFYRTFMDHAFMAGGDLPADAEALAAAVHMPLRNVEKALGFCLGRLIFQDGDRLYQGRVRREIASELEFRKEQARRGAEGGKVAGKGRPKPTVSHPPIETIGPPSPSPSPAPTPAPIPTTAPPNGGAGGRAATVPTAAPPAPPASVLSGGDLLDHDPSDPVETRLASRIDHLARMTTAREGTPADPAEILAAVSVTPEGKSLDHIRGAPSAWVEATLRACDAFEADNFGGEEPPS